MTAHAVRALATVALVATMAASSRAPSPRDQPADPTRPVEHRGGTVTVDAASLPPDANASCIEACVRARQAEATSIDYIRQSCAGQCNQPIPPALP